MLYYIQNFTDKHMKFFASLLIAAFALPTSLLADEFNTFLIELETLEEEIQTMEQAQERVQFEVEYESHQDIFPRGAKYEQDVTGARTTSASETHVSIRVNNIPVVLNDVPLDAWFAPYVRDMGGIISGYTDTNGTPLGQYGPADNVLRNQLAKIAINASGKNVEACPDRPLNASASGTWAQRFVSCAEMYGFSIYQDYSLDMNAPATRAEVIVTILDAFEIELMDATGSMFEDVTLEHPLRDPIETAANLGIVSGYKDANGVNTNLFGPDNNINRAEIAKVVALTIQVAR